MFEFRLWVLFVCGDVPVDSFEKGLCHAGRRP